MLLSILYSLIAKFITVSEEFFFNSFYKYKMLIKKVIIIK